MIREKLSCSQRFFQKRKLYEKHPDPTGQIAERKGFHGKMQQENQNQRRRDAHAHICHGADQRDPKISHAAEEALDTVGYGREQIHEGDQAKILHSVVDDLRIAGGKQNFLIRNVYTVMLNFKVIANVSR